MRSPFPGETAQYSPPQRELKYAIYVRKSTEAEERQILSIETQIRKARELDASLQTAAVFEERHSAFEPGKRPAFQRLLDLVDRGEIDGIIAWHPDRLSRNEEDAAKVTYRVRKGVIKDLRFCSYQFVNSPEGIMMLQLALSQSQYFSSKLSNDVKRGIEQKLTLGWRPGAVGIGYLNETVNHTVIRDPDRFLLVRRMWDLLLAGQHTPGKIADIAAGEWGLVTPVRGRTGGGPLARSAVYRMFQNPFYAGFIRHNGRLYPGSHDAMVTTAEFERAQEIMASRARTHFTIRRQFAYTGLIHCARCGAHYTAEIQKGHIYYHCTGHKTGVVCRQRKHVREESLERMLVAVMARYTIPLAFRLSALRYLQETHNLEVAKEEQARAALVGQIGSLDKRLDGLIDMKMRELLSDDDFRYRQHTTKEEMARLQKALDEARGTSGRVVVMTARVFDLAAYGQQVLKAGSTPKRRTIAHSIADGYQMTEAGLRIKIVDWLVPIGEDFPLIQAERQQLAPPTLQDGETGAEDVTQAKPGPRYVRTSETRDDGSAKERTVASATDMSLWLCTVDKVRTIVSRNIASIHLPEFDALGDVVLDPDPDRMG
jgi:DNA invertase Pin-like site-specific DNA recombinase